MKYKYEKDEFVKKNQRYYIRDGARRSSLSWNMGDNRHRYIDCP